MEYLMSKENTFPNFHNIFLDEEGHLCEHTDWNIDVAQKLANTLEISLTEEHYLVLAVVRDFFNKFQHSPSTRPLIKYLQQQLPNLELDNQKLQKMFNTGLVARHVNRIAGLPKPPNCL